YSDFYKENEAILKQNLGEFADIEQLNRAIQNADRDVERYESEKRKYQYNEDMTKKYSGLQAQSDFSDLAKKGAATLPQYSSLTDVRNMSDSDVAALYINANEDDRRNIYNIHEYSGKVLNDLQYMNDQEIATYNAVRASEGEKAGKEYLEFIAPVLLRRGYFTQQEELETKVRDNAGYAVAQNVGTVLTSPLKGLDYLGAVINKATGGNDNDALGYVGDYTMSPANASEIVRSTTQENIKSPVLRFAYNTGMSVLDNVMNIAVTGGSGAATLPLMGSGAASQTYSSAKAKGLTEDEALSMGLLSGVLETATESIGLDNLFSIIQKEGGQAGWELVKSIASQIGAEGTEEVLAEFGNAFLDRFVSGDLSDYNISVQRYMEDGLTADEANKKATSDFFKQVGEAFLSGGFSGGIMGGGAAAFNGITYNAAENRARGQEILDTMGYDNLRAFAQDVVENGSKAAEHRVSKAIDRIDGKTNTQAYLERNPQAAARVYDKVESAIGKQNKRFRDVADAIKKETSLPDSVSNKVARKITKDIVNRKNFKRSDYNSLLAGIDFTDADKNGNSDRKTRILDAIKSRFDITAKDFTERNAKYTAAMLGAERDENGKIVLGSTDEIADAEIDITDVTDAHVSDDGVTRNAAGEEIKLVGFDSVRNADGKVELVYKLDDGSTISTNDVEYASEDEAVLYESIANMGVNSLVANSFIKAYDPSTGVSPEAYVRGIAKAYRYGQY
ncbi:MAG: hypothetical protein IKK29_03095, partial [Christensenellaceae bacterium]|nr:hypothetical protein [Christensenellaceae bacterium]